MRNQNIRVLLIALTITLAPVISCRQAETVLPGDCFDAKTVTHRVSSVPGIVGYYSDPSQLTISYSLPGTIDSQWTGIVCNLPKEYQVVGKRVTFSGEFLDANGKFKPVLGGQEIYYLSLTNIQPL